MDLSTFTKNFYHVTYNKSENSIAPYCPEYNDFYYMPQYGLAERRYLYLDDQQIFERSNTHDSYIVLSEIGFGTGLTFLSALKLWKQRAQHLQQRPLIYISFEKNPLSKKQLQETLTYWRDELGEEIDELSERWVGLLPGVNHLIWLEERVCLILIIGDAFTEIQRCNFHSTHWILDGFSPSRNPDAWALPLLQEISRCSADGCTLTSFTGSRVVEKNLTDCGWNVTREKGFALKKYRMTGKYSRKIIKHNSHLVYQENMTVLGAGIAGMSVGFWRNFFKTNTNCRFVPGLNASCVPHVYLHPPLHQKLDFFTQLSIRSHVLAGSTYRQLAKLANFNYTAGSVHHKTHTYRTERVWHLLSQDIDWQDFVQETADGYYFPQSGRFHGGLCLQALSDLSNQITLEKSSPHDALPSLPYTIACSWAAPIAKDFTMLRGEITLQDNGCYTPSTYDRYCFKPIARDISKENFVGFRTHTSSYNPVIKQDRAGIFYSVFHGTRGFSTGMLGGLEIALESCGIFNYHSNLL
ncbi:MAG: tRNA (5-methylaminomethyl-2-thiouridine)(34)-methyltransferase MnmD [Gammaproteobacteria bacterium]|nr:tRNA (5-methylaminomethyl-2-thiouridine)(34)-methyltransferase MnmD [Gammaproteobacteria bacterium]